MLQSENEGMVEVVDAGNPSGLRHHCRLNPRLG
jgi:hypothetical protein